MTKSLTLPYRHYYYLNVFRLLRRVSIQEAIKFLYNNIDENSHNWIDTRFAHYDKPPVEIDISDLEHYKLTAPSLMLRIQGLPHGIKPITDGPYALDVKFEQDSDYTILHLLGYKIYDYQEPRIPETISNILPLIKDKLPFPMSLSEYSTYRDAGSQFWRLIQEKEKETMPQLGEVAMDVGAHIGFRALAMHYCAGPNGKVYAIEVEDDNFKLLQKNIEANNLKNMFGIQEAVDSIGRTATLYTRDRYSMAHGLRSFENIEDPSAIDRVENKTSFTKEVQTITLDDLMKKYNIDKIDNMHISVTGHEIEVVNGLNSFLPRLKKLRVSCPYTTEGVPNVDTVKGIMEKKGFSNFQRHGSAIIGDR